MGKENVNYLQEIENIAHELPLIVLLDIDSRCKDWMSSGGSASDPYIKQQLRYANNFIERMKKNNGENARA